MYTELFLFYCSITISSIYGLHNSFTIEIVVTYYWGFLSVLEHVGQLVGFLPVHIFITLINVTTNSEILWGVQYIIFILNDFLLGGGSALVKVSARFDPPFFPMHNHYTYTHGFSDFMETYCIMFLVQYCCGRLSTDFYTQPHYYKIHL